MKTKLTALWFSLLLVGMADAQNSDTLLTYDHRSLVVRFDLSFNTPAPSTHDGLPIGNGRMGTLVWTTPAALHFQINDVDLFCNDKNTLASPKGHTDYSSGCGYVDINLVDFGNDVFAGDKFNQHLSVYEGLESADGDGVKTRSLAWTDGDVIATEVDDQRSRPGTINIDLRMLRYGRISRSDQAPRLSDRTARKSGPAITWPSRAWTSATGESCSPRNSPKASSTSPRPWPSPLWGAPPRHRITTS